MLGNQAEYTKKIYNLKKAEQIRKKSVKTEILKQPRTEDRICSANIENPLCSDSGGLCQLYHYALTNQFSLPHCHYDERQRGDNLEHKNTNSIFAF